MRKLGVFVGLALGVAVAGSAQAQDGMGGTDPMMPPPASEDSSMAATTSTMEGGVPPQLVRRSVQGPAGQLSIRAILHANMSKGAVFKPFSIAPDVFYGVSDKLQVGLLHNRPMGWQTLPGAGLCLAGQENGCPKVYNNVGFDALYRLVEGDTEISGHGTLYLSTLDPLALGVALGVAGKAHLSDQLAIWFDPQLYIGLTERDTLTPMGFNKEMLYIPAELQFQAQDQLALVLLTGLWAPLDGFGDAFIIPVGVGAFYNVNEMIDVGGRFSFDNLLGKNNSADFRSLALLVNVRP